MKDLASQIEKIITGNRTAKYASTEISDEIYGYLLQFSKRKKKPSRKSLVRAVALPTLRHLLLIEGNAAIISFTHFNQACRNDECYPSLCPRLRHCLGTKGLRDGLVSFYAHPCLNLSRCESSIRCHINSSRFAYDDRISCSICHVVLASLALCSRYLATSATGATRTPPSR